MGLGLCAAAGAEAGGSAPQLGPVATRSALAAPRPDTAATATFAGGCFWCMESSFEKAGLKNVVSGYSGGRTLNPTYDEVSAGGTGHTESIQISYDPRRTTYAQLLDLFWHNVDPTDGGGQFCDRGSQYRSVIFYRTETEKRLAEESKHAIEASGRIRRPIATQIVPFVAFTPAEEYHQDFYKKNPVRYYTYRAGCGRDRRLAELWGKSGH
jgi:peptide-methionine (S)-S-oxide reductase